VELGATSDAFVEIELDCDDDYLVLFFLGSRELGSVRVPRLCLEERGLRRRTLAAPEAARAKGFDAIWVLPDRGRRPYDVGAVRAR
jgi:hypothetical protein